MGLWFGIMQYVFSANISVGVVCMVKVPEMTNFGNTSDLVQFNFTKQLTHDNKTNEDLIIQNLELQNIDLAIIETKVELPPGDNYDGIFTESLQSVTSERIVAQEEYSANLKANRSENVNVLKSTEGRVCKYSEGSDSLSPVSDR